MADFCGDCAHLDTNGGCKWGDEYYCEVTCKYTSVSRKACSNFVPKPDKGYHRAGFSFWYVVTKICNMLNIDLESDFYRNLFSIRDYLENTPDGLNFLTEYDHFGPIISACINNEGLDFACAIMDNILVPCEELVKQNDFANAAMLYQEMIGVLKVRYGLIDFKVDYLELQQDFSKARIR